MQKRRLTNLSIMPKAGSLSGIIMSIFALLENALTIILMLAEHVNLSRKVNNHSTVTFLILKITVTFIILK